MRQKLFYDIVLLISKLSIAIIFKLRMFKFKSVDIVTLQNLQNLLPEPLIAL